MTRPAGFAIALWFGLTLAAACPVGAHHSYAIYDAAQTRSLTGTVTAFAWANPHVRFKMLVDLPGRGDAQEWRIESSSPAILVRFGWTRHSIKPGDRINVICNPLSDGSHGGRLHTLVMLNTGLKLETKLSAPAEGVELR